MYKHVKATLGLVEPNPKHGLGVKCGVKRNPNNINRSLITSYPNGATKAWVPTNIPQWILRIGSKQI